MLDQFYSYLSEKIIEFFKDNPLEVGAKYNIQFETDEQVEELIKALKENNLAEEFHYTDKGEVKYTSYMLNFGKVKLIVASTKDNVQPDFLTRLRNMVGMEVGYEDKAILFIHNTTLDSIMGGTESFSKEGMPFHIESIQKDIKKKLAVSEFKEVDKKIIELDLERKKTELFQDNGSVFEYKEILETINSTCIDREHYKNFGLFYDSDLGELTGAKLKKRLETNALYFSRVDEIHNYGNPETQLERYFDEKGIDKLKKSDWKSVDYKEVNASIEGVKGSKVLEYISSSAKWDKEEGKSKVKQRIRNILVFNEDNLDKVDLEFSFDDYVRKDGLSTDGEVEAVTSGKKIKATIFNTEGKSNFYKITYKNDKGIKFDFKIVMLHCNEKVFDSVFTKFSIVYKGKKVRYISINTNEPEVIFNGYFENKSEYNLSVNNEKVELLDGEKLVVKIGDNYQYEGDSDIAFFDLKIKDRFIPIGIVGTNEKIAPIEGLKVWNLKREKESNFKLVGDNKLYFGTREYFARDEFRKNLELEKELINLEGLCFTDTVNGLEIKSLELDKAVNIAYNNILDFYKKSGNIPSLMYLNDDLKMLYNDFIKEYVRALNSIEEGSYLNNQQRNLFKIGVIYREVEDREILLTPLHPLNIAYQLHLSNEVGVDSISDEVIKKLTSTYLLPYVQNSDDRLYVPMEQHHSPEWKYYVDEALPRYKGSRDFVAKLVHEKIEEFVGHFKYMFDMATNAPIKLNLINTGDSKEILQGVLKYYVKLLKGNKKVEPLPMEIFIYADKNITSAFEEAAFNDDIEDLKSTYGLDLTVDSLSEEDVLKIYREKVHFYTKKVEDGIEYAHITFLEMSNDIKAITSKSDDIPSGVILNGLISGVPSTFLGDTYRTGFGTKYANNDTSIMNVATRLNALNSAASGEPFGRNQCKAIAVSNNAKLGLEAIYDASHWITFINPKVDLNFFKNDPDAKDLLIIHYSDQYTTAGGYDAITVTRKSGPYQRVIEEFLEKKDIENASDYSPKVINMFNAINGDWLLRLLSSKSHFPKEKISILSAIKLGLAEFKKEGVIWIPISLEEILRVSGGAGLKQSDGFLSAKNLGFDNSGATSDDILFVGVEVVDGKVYVHYYPVEVKIGENTNQYIQKGIEQAKQTKKIFDTIFSKDEEGNITTTQRIYRNFLMQLVITSAEKLKLYNVCEEENWGLITDSDIRRRLLNEDYEVSPVDVTSMGEAAVISFKRGLTFNDKKIEDGVMVIEMSEDDGVNFITKSISEIREVLGENVIDSSIDIEGLEDNNPVIVDDGIEAVEPAIKDTEPDEIDQGYVDTLPIEQEVLIVNDTNRNMEVLFGHNVNNNKEIIWEPNNTDKVFHTNTGIIGTMGTGKTQFTKSLVTQLHRESYNNVEGKNVGILIFDYKGDYNKSKTDFIEATNAKVYELYHLPFNPLSVVKAVNSKPMLPLHIANGLKVTLAKAFGLGIKQETFLRDLIMEAYEKRGIIKHKPDTWDNPAPTLKDVYDIYINRDDLKEDSLYAAFSNLIDFEIFEPNPHETKSLFDLIDGVTVIDLSGYDPDIQNLVVAITLDLFYSQMQAYGHSGVKGNLRQLNKMILVDEADNFLSKDFETLKKILKEGREFGVGTILSTQLLSHFSTGNNDYSNYILTWVVHNVADLSNKDVKYIFNTQSKQEEETLFTKIKSLTKHHSLVKMGDSSIPIHMKDKAFWELEK
ncbi:DNA phosphorothioation-dependent restriction protein DptH [Clostridium sp. NSJ-6]|uniref:DNA phosphorothioation-dependent restriction protein DptH n=1 Tax=Clostridium hominis TaxID=2763036 RepID=A0ABR7DDJ8_9CLOT|nr:DNA phosphorothioation-dependent restriction protein DptH [Clostridium hominis]MBC5629471.1 DNA phosphorothioation-dependent restriction protein DptH [Clostridium hominis]